MRNSIVFSLATLIAVEILVGCKPKVPGSTVADLSTNEGGAIRIIASADLAGQTWTSACKSGNGESRRDRQYKFKVDAPDARSRFPMYISTSPCTQPLWGPESSVLVFK
jgi:hypothetical protein